MRWPWLSLLLATATVAAAGSAWVIGRRPLDLPAERSPPRDDAGHLKAETVELRLADLSDYPDLTTRPPFTPTRRLSPSAPLRPAEPAPAPPATTLAETEVPPPDARLVGVILAGGDRAALLVRRQADVVTFVRQGEIFDGWELAVVRPGAVTLLSAGRTTEFQLFERE